MNAILEVRDLVAGYGDHEILRGLSVRVEPGEIVAVIGPNGAGKSTLLKAIAGLLPARQGAVRFRDHDLIGVSPAEIIARGLCYVPQEANVFASLSVGENLTVGAYTAPATLAERADAVFDLFPSFASAVGPGGHPLGRRASDARPGHGPDDRAEPPDPRRALGRARPGSPAIDLRPRP